jgi:hypothetical protein
MVVSRLNSDLYDAHNEMVLMEQEQVSQTAFIGYVDKQDLAVPSTLDVSDCTYCFGTPDSTSKIFDKQLGIVAEDVIRAPWQQLPIMLFTRDASSTESNALSFVPAGFTNEVSINNGRFIRHYPALFKSLSKNQEKDSRILK